MATFFCECNGICLQTVQVPMSVMQQIMREGYFLLAPDCLTPLEAGEEVIESHPNYKVVRGSLTREEAMRSAMEKS